MIVSNGKVLDQCWYCGKWCNLSGFFHGMHICLLPEEREAKERGWQTMRVQQDTHLNQNQLEILRKLGSDPNINKRLEAKRSEATPTNQVAPSKSNEGVK